MDKIQCLKKVKKNGSSLGVSIPAEVCELLGIKEGDFVELGVRKIHNPRREILGGN